LTRHETFPKVRALAFPFSTAYTARSAIMFPALHCAQRCIVRSIVAPSATLHPALHSAQHCAAFGARGSKLFAGEAKRSGKRGYCSAFNIALPAQQRFETLPKVCALALAFSTAHIQRAALHSAQRHTAPSATLRPALHSA